MNNKQRQLVWKWVIAVVGLLVFMIFFDAIVEKAPWLQWVVFIIYVFALAISRPVQQTDAPQDRLNRLVEEYPALKWWLAINCLVILSTFVLVTHSSIRLEDLFGFRILVIVIALIIGPFVAIGERRKYEAYGKERESILTERGSIK